MSREVYANDIVAMRAAPIGLWPSLRRVAFPAIFMVLLVAVRPAVAATYVATSDINLNSANWNTVDATGTLISTSTGTTALTTSNQDSTGFVLANATYQYFAFRVGTRASGSPSNKLTITLFNFTAGAGTRDCAGAVMNVSDIPAVANTTDDNGGWLLVKCAASFTANGTDTYKLRAVLDSTSTALALSTNGTAANWQRVIVKSTTGTPGAGDDMYVAGPCDASANPCTFSTRTVTMNQTAATDYGSANASYRQCALCVSKSGVVAFGVAASTNYILQLSGDLVVYSSGEFDMGQSGATIDSTSTATLQIDQTASDNQFGIYLRFGTFRSWSGLTYSKAWTTLAADISAAATSFTTTDTTGWKNGDTISFASTTATIGNTEQKALGADCSGTTCGTVAALTNAHGGNASTKIQGEVADMKRGNVIKTTTAANMVNITCYGCTLDLSWTELNGMSTNNGVASGSGISIENSTNTVTIDSCTFIAGEGWAINLISGATGSVALSNNVSYNNSSGGVGGAWVNVKSGSTSLTTISITNNLVLTSSGTGWAYEIDAWSSAVTFTGNHGATAATPFLMSAATATSCGSWSANVGHSGSSNFNFTGPIALGGCTLGSTVAWRNTGNANTGNLVFVTNTVSDIVFDTWTIFGSPVNQSNMTFAVTLSNLTFVSSTLNGDATIASGRGANSPNNDGAMINVVFENCSFSDTTAHTQDDLRTPTNRPFQVTLRNTLLAASTEVSNLTTTPAASQQWIASEKHDQTAGQHKILTSRGTLALETTTVEISPSVKLTPSSATFKLDSAAGIGGRGTRYRLANGSTITIAVDLQKDGSYNGNNPRLIQRANSAIGVTTDTVLQTCTVANGSWTTCSGTTAAATDDGLAEFVVDVDGTAGSVYVDNWVADGNALDDSYWQDGLPYFFVPAIGGVGIPILIR